MSLYSRDGSDQLLAAGQSSQTQFESQPTSTRNDYLIAKYNPTTNQLVVSDGVGLISLRNLPNQLKRAAEDEADQSYIQQRTNLGLAFGTKKAIRELNTQQRNKLDQNSFGTSTRLSSVLHESIATQSSSLPSTTQIELAANLARPIPTPNFSAQSPKQVYNIADVVPLNELSAIDLTSILAADNFKDRLSVLPFRRSRFIQNKLRQLFPQSRAGEAISTKDQTKLSYVYYLSYLFAFRQAATPNKDHQLSRQNLADKLSAPLVIVDGLLSRFTEEIAVGSEQKRKVTSYSQAKVLGYLCVLILFLDNWSTEVGTIASDLGVGERKVDELFKSVGCSLVSASAGERERLLELGIAKTPAEARKAKKATLTVPLEFPKERKTKAKR